MKDQQKPTQKQSAVAAKQKRLAEALRQNLQKRKQQPKKDSK